MNENNYGEVINGNDTYKFIADSLRKGKTVGIGWTDEMATHLDIIFKLGIDIKCGNFQRGIKTDYLFVSIIDYSSYGFCIKNGIKFGGYIQEKMRMQNECGNKLAELINGIIDVLNKEE